MLLLPNAWTPLGVEEDQEENRLMDPAATGGALALPSEDRTSAMTGATLGDRARLLRLLLRNATPPEAEAARTSAAPALRAATPRRRTSRETGEALTAAAKLPGIAIAKAVARTTSPAIAIATADVLRLR